MSAKKGTVQYISISRNLGKESAICAGLSKSKGDYAALMDVDLFIFPFLSAWFAICFCFLIQDFIEIWLGEELKLSWTAAILFSIYIDLHGEAMNIKIMRESIGLWEQG